MTIDIFLELEKHQSFEKRNNAVKYIIHVLLHIFLSSQ